MCATEINTNWCHVGFSKWFICVSGEPTVQEHLDSKKKVFETVTSAGSYVLFLLFHHCVLADILLQY